MRQSTFERFLFTGILICALLLPAVCCAEEAVPFKLTTEIPHCRTIWIGVLQGTWQEMGIQYGQRCGEDIAHNFDIFWESMVLQEGGGWKKGRSKNERVSYCVAYMERSMRELLYLSPELIEMLEGIAEGAAKEFAKGKYADACSNIVKLMILNWGHLPLHPDWDFEKDAPRVAKVRKSGKRYAQTEEHDCNGFWVHADATKTGETYATRTVQMWSVERAWSWYRRQVSYVAIPKDPKARVFWAQSEAGNLGGLGGGLMNDQGLCVLTSGCSYSEEHWKQVDETCAPGIKDFMLATYGVIFSKTPEEAAKKVTVGTPLYRKLTGRKTVLRARGAEIVFANAEKAICVEQNAYHYALRKPGDLGEKGASYIVHANHHKCDTGSFDENGNWHQDEPMTMYEPEKEGNSTYYRFWSGMWMLNNNYGQIDREMVMRELATSHIGYDKDGNRYDPDPETGTPTVPGTFCTHNKPFTKEHPLGMGGNNESSVFNLSTLEVWWVPVWPCHYKEWNLSWDYCNLKPFADYRKMLWHY